MIDLKLEVSDEKFHDDNIEKIKVIDQFVQDNKVDELRALLFEEKIFLYRNVFRFTSSNLLAFAAEEGKLGICRMLIDLGANLEPEPDNYPAPLRLAASEGRLDVVKLLIDAGANVDGPRNGIITPLMSATISGHKDVVKYLLNVGANPNRFHLRLFKTPLDSALVWKHPEIESILRSTQAVSILEGIDWSNHPSKVFLTWIETNFGKILPIDFDKFFDTENVAIRLALANKNKNKILFTTGLSAILKEPFELSVILPDTWNPYNISVENSFPIDFLAKLAGRVQLQKASLEGTFASPTDFDMKALIWPTKLISSWVGKRMADDHPLMIYGDKVKQMEFFAVVPVKNLGKKYTSYDPGIFQDLSFTKLTFPI